jgi:hypothetical protein
VSVLHLQEVEVPLLRRKLQNELSGDPPVVEVLHVQVNEVSDASVIVQCSKQSVADEHTLAPTLL